MADVQLRLTIDNAQAKKAVQEVQQLIKKFDGEVSLSPIQHDYKTTTQKTNQSNLLPAVLTRHSRAIIDSTKETRELIRVIKQATSTSTTFGSGSTTINGFGALVPLGREVGALTRQTMRLNQHYQQQQRQSRIFDVTAKWIDEQEQQKKKRFSFNFGDMFDAFTRMRGGFGKVGKMFSESGVTGSGTLRYGANVMRGAGMVGGSRLLMAGVTGGLAGLGATALISAISKSVEMGMSGASKIKDEEAYAAQLGTRIGGYGSDFARTRKDIQAAGYPWLYSQQETAQVVDTFISQGGAKDWRKHIDNTLMMSRATGLDPNYLADTYGFLVKKGATDTKAISEGFVGAIKKSGMEGREMELIDGMKQLVEQNAANRLNFSQQDFENLLSSYTMWSEIDPSLKGEKAAKLTAGLDSMFKEAWQDEELLYIMGYGSKYKGPEGLWKLFEQLEKGMADKDNIRDFLTGVQGMSKDPATQKHFIFKKFADFGMNNTELINMILKEKDKIIDTGEMSEELQKKLKEYGKEEIQKKAGDYLESDTAIDKTFDLDIDHMEKVFGEFVTGIERAGKYFAHELFGNEDIGSGEETLKKESSKSNEVPNKAPPNPMIGVGYKQTTSTGSRGSSVFNAQPRLLGDIETQGLPWANNTDLPASPIADAGVPDDLKITPRPGTETNTITDSIPSPLDSPNNLITGDQSKLELETLLLQKEVAILQLKELKGGSTGSDLKNERMIKQLDESLARVSYTTREAIDKGMATTSRSIMSLALMNMSGGFGGIAGGYDIAQVSLGDGSNWQQFHNTGLRTGFNMSPAEINAWIEQKAPAGSVMRGMGQAFHEAAKQTGLDVRYLVAHAAHETAWGTSRIVKDKANWFGIAAYDSSPYSSAYSYKDYGAGIIEGAKWLLDNYINAGQNTLYLMNHGHSWHNYASDPEWDEKIARIMATAPALTTGAVTAGGVGTLNINVSGSIKGLTTVNNNAVTSALTRKINEAPDISYIFAQGSKGVKI